MDKKQDEREAPPEKLTRRAFLSLVSFTAMVKPRQEEPLDDKKKSKK